jgi:hypothetical protein
MLEVRMWIREWGGRSVMQSFSPGQNWGIAVELIQFPDEFCADNMSKEAFEAYCAHLLRVRTYQTPVPMRNCSYSVFVEVEDRVARRRSGPLFGFNSAFSRLP